MASIPEKHLLCPKKKRTIIRQDEDGTIIVEEQFGLCDRQFCAAWSKEERLCLLYNYELIDDDDDDD